MAERASLSLTSAAGDANCIVIFLVVLLFVITLILNFNSCDAFVFFPISGQQTVQLFCCPLFAITNCFEFLHNTALFMFTAWSRVWRKQ